MISDKHQYLFDLQGYLVIKGAIANRQLREISELIDRGELDDPGKRVPQGHYQALLQDHAVLRELMINDRISPYLEEWTSSPPASGYRLDHCYFIFSDAGAPGQRLHLGATPYIPSCYHHVRGNRIFSGLTVVSYVLNEVIAGEGGFACIPGSHKSNFPCPASIADLTDSDHVYSPAVEPGDAIIFTEALTHGSLPWKSSHRRRALFYKYSPRHMSWMRPQWSARLLELCTSEQRALLQAPHVHDNPSFFVATAE
jgi:ectoine hydroxylase-related dioxygenase (phytanoyl-CoA dioxygenase family)